MARTDADPDIFSPAVQVAEPAVEHPVLPDGPECFGKDLLAVIRINGIDGALIKEPRPVLPVRSDHPVEAVI